MSYKVKKEKKNQKKNKKCTDFSLQFVMLICGLLLERNAESIFPCTIERRIKLSSHYI